ncbi:hypothetical protein NG99_13000 [Erwinia typographi]|uniref:2-methylcitrate dehydratase n=1 Tax=Erwinia typographi TaxID=371042 RepID=A0A0A3Z5D3_9GAMM|nr:MmgE/PrpD family protein [Erwinia typographi]KGT92856.1 hypothetical protein NG99_13000 [Erwinia typographi]
MNQRPALASLAEWLINQRTAVLPDDILHIARRCLIDTVGVMLPGSTRSVSEKIRQTLPLGEGEACLIGLDRRTDPLSAALINGVAAHALDFDDNCYAGFVHGSAVIIPAALAVADTCGASGEQLLRAVALGSECQYRLGMALDNQLYHAGWWTTGMLGAVGACAAAAVLLDLDSGQCANALGMAIACASGMKAIFGTDSKPLLAGLAAQRGIMCAFMAQAGMSGPVDVIEHPAGLVALCNNRRLIRKWVQEPSSQWCLREPGIDVKRIPVCLSSHAAVDALLCLRQQHGFTARDVTRIECNVPEIVCINLKYDRPVNGQQAQFSLPFALAQALIAGDVTLSHLDDANVLTPELQTLMAKVSSHTGTRWSEATLATLAPEGAEITVYLNNGNSHSHFVAKARGAASAPLSDDELSNKFMQCCQSVMPGDSAHKLLTHLWRIEEPANQHMSSYWRATS